MNLVDTPAQLPASSIHEAQTTTRSQSLAATSTKAMLPTTMSGNSAFAYASKHRETILEDMQRRMSKVVDGLRGDAFVVARDVGLDSIWYPGDVHDSQS